MTDGGYAQAYHAVPLSSYFSSAVPQDYLAASGARIQMTLDFQAKEVDDSYQYVQILADQTSACDSGAGSKVVRHPLAEGAAIWRRYLAVLPAEAPRFLEFLPGDDPFLLPQEAASLRPPFAG